MSSYVHLSCLYGLITLSPIVDSFLVQSIIPPLFGKYRACDITHRYGMVSDVESAFLVAVASSTEVVVNAATTTTTTSTNADATTWRQYVPLAVSCLVIVDILLGSPLANSVIRRIRQAAPPNADGWNESESSLGLSSSRPERSPSQTVESTSSERIDSKAVAQAAIDKAQSTLELKRFLEDRTTDWDRMDEMRRKMDQQLQELDNKQKENGN